MLAKATPSRLRTVFHAGPSTQMNWFTTAGAGGQIAAGSRPGDHAMNGNAVMFDSGKILTLGGSTAYGTGNSGQPATAAAAVITLPATGTAQPTVTLTGSMAFARGYCNSVVMPDGKVVTFGGMPVPIPFSDTDAVLTPGVLPCG
jgi:galactose oxidase